MNKEEANNGSVLGSSFYRRDAIKKEKLKSAVPQSSTEFKSLAEISEPNGKRPKSQPTNLVKKEKNFTYLFAPIAYVFRTDVEQHDIFKEIMLLLFESIRKPLSITGNRSMDQKLAYAEFLTHIAFLATIPCPTFNTQFKVQFFNKTLTIEEPSYNMIPSKNQIALRVLFDSLDVKTILFCWKAILLDYKLILISGQASL